ncbi:HAD family hydrolase [Amycolatopsis keratiniphila]|uniref:HAD family hydrolase n=1 Tax=Amycolatopsis keratiniphila subsp. keratiniphila TaxID=227715 RepID=A0A1W2LJE8_9PSEU|nr:HAD family phosphatase [Amycolatopsis keratiniphila]OLZ59990.1 HAD family hydrolase [Amycolatopsis keratiniphila subsp. nogabecina]ONF62977.1 HAD family hydrolase [Amycolatopsis keratiniphila subsp. keratiniphila]SDU56754.1 haloacid dehalogenase superfamily, subfamily IA, variant 3 with third motif having DD or ED [Amycolatopsis keratiniphila]
MEAVIFDLDGVLVDSEKMWDEVRRAVVHEFHGTWREESTRAMQGMSTPEWAAYLAHDLGVQLRPEDVAQVVIDRMARRYAEKPPIIPGAPGVVREVAKHWPVAIASSSPPLLIKAFLDITRLPVPTAVSSEQVGAGKPAPDVYLKAAELLGAEPKNCAAVEDTTNGLRAALAAGMTVYAVPNPHFPPDPAVLEQTTVVSVITDLPSVLQAD